MQHATILKRNHDPWSSRCTPTSPKHLGTVSPFHTLRIMFPVAGVSKLAGGDTDEPYKGKRGQERWQKMRENVIKEWEAEQGGSRRFHRFVNRLLMRDRNETSRTLWAARQESRSSESRRCAGQGCGEGV